MRRICPYSRFKINKKKRTFLPVGSLHTAPGGLLQPSSTWGRGSPSTAPWEPLALFSSCSTSLLPALVMQAGTEELQCCVVTHEWLDQTQKPLLRARPAHSSQHLPTRETWGWPAQGTSGSSKTAPCSLPGGTSLLFTSTHLILSFSAKASRSEHD